MIHLHASARGAINACNPNKTVTLYCSADMVNNRGELKKTQYMAGETVGAQIQSLSNDNLYATNAESQNDVSRNCYLFPHNSTTDKPASIIRSLASTCDMVQRENGAW